MLYNFCIKTI